VPFEFLRRKPKTSPADGSEPAAPGTSTGGAEGGSPTGARRGRPVPLDGFTEEWHLTGTMWIDGRLSDALNRRESITLDEVMWAPSDVSGEPEPAPGLKAVDPYDLILVLSGPESIPQLSDEQRAAFKVRKVPFDVAVEAPPFRVVGTVYLHPGTEPERLMERASDMFVVITDAVALVGEREVAGNQDAIMVNRFYLRGVKQVDKRTGEPVTPLPGQPLGGTSWQDRSR
jgi:hypothetical protein